jgi:hypothetical protein
MIKKQHGGKRKGAGRKKKAPTKVTRIPEHLHEDVIQFIKEKVNGKKGNRSNL